MDATNGEVVQFGEGVLVTPSRPGHQVDQMGGLQLAPQWLFTVAGAGLPARPPRR